MACCPETGRLGIATATRSLAVGARVPHVAARSGVVAIMAVADERLGRRALEVLAQGIKAPAVVDALVAGDPNPEYGQLGGIDDDGFRAARTGARKRDFAGHRIGANHIALGNVLVGPHVPDAIEAGFTANQGVPLEDRLMAALEAGRPRSRSFHPRSAVSTVAPADWPRARQAWSPRDRPACCVAGRMSPSAKAAEEPNGTGVSLRGSRCSREHRPWRDAATSQDLPESDNRGNAQLCRCYWSA